MNIILKSGAFIIAASLLTAGLGPAQTFAQTAKNLKCKGCVGKKDIGKKAVKSKHIKPGQITSAHIENGVVGPADLSNEAKPSGADVAETTTDTDLAPLGDDIVLHTVTLTAPGPGIALASAVLTADYQGVAGRFACAVNTEVALGGQYVSGQSVGDGEIPVGITRPFSVDAAGNLTLYLFCRGISGDVRVNNPILTAWFVPGKY